MKLLSGDREGNRDRNGNAVERLGGARYRHTKQKKKKKKHQREIKYTNEKVNMIEMIGDQNTTE